MVDLANKRCAHQGCTKRASHGKAGGKVEYCRDHAEDGMENVKDKRCIHHGCTKGPSYGKVGGRAEYCKEHAEDGMESVVSKKCAHHGCTKGPSYGKAGGKAEYCKEHAEDGMEKRRQQEVRSNRLYDGGAAGLANTRGSVGSTPSRAWSAEARGRICQKRNGRSRKLGGKIWRRRWPCVWLRRGSTSAPGGKRGTSC